MTKTIAKVRTEEELKAQRKQHNINPMFEEIANKVLDVPTLQARRSDSLDFHEVSVWGLEKALRKAYAEGIKKGFKAGRIPVK